MYKEVSNLIIYGDMDKNSILSCLADIFYKFENGGSSKSELTKEVYTQVKRILSVATDYGGSLTLHF